MSLTMIRYKTIFYLLIMTFVSCSGFTLHMMYPKYPSNFRITRLSFGVSACRYAPGASKVLTYITVYVLVTIVVDRSSNETIVDNIIPSSCKCF